MLAAADDGGMEITKSLLESGGGWVEGLVLGKARALFAEGHKKARQRFEIRRVVHRDLYIPSVHGRMRNDTTTYKHGKLDASPDQGGNFRMG